MEGEVWNLESWKWGFRKNNAYRICCNSVLICFFPLNADSNQQRNDRDIEGQPFRFGSFSLHPYWDRRR